MDNQPKEMSNSKPVHNCGSCRHLRLRWPTDNKNEVAYLGAGHWCQKNDMATTMELLRCGGDDWEAAQVSLSISIDRLAKSWAVFNDTFNCLKAFEPYTSEDAALAAGKAWCKDHFGVDTPEVVYPNITSIRLSTARPRRRKKSVGA